MNLVRTNNDPFQICICVHSVSLLDSRFITFIYFINIFIEVRYFLFSAVICFFNICTGNNASLTILAFAATCFFATVKHPFQFDLLSRHIRSILYAISLKFIQKNRFSIFSLPRLCQFLAEIRIFRKQGSIFILRLVCFCL